MSAKRSVKRSAKRSAKKSNKMPVKKAESKWSKIPAKSKCLYLYGACSLIALIVYGFFCKNDDITWNNIIELLVMAIVTSIVIVVPRIKIKVLDKLVSLAVLAASPFFILQFILYDRTLKHMSNYWLEILIVVIIMLFVLIFVRKTAAAIAGAAGLSAFFVVANEMALCFRNAALSPTDFFSLRTAIAVSGEYRFVITYKAVIAVFAAVSIIIIAFKTNIDLKIASPKLSPKISLGLNLVLTIIPLAAFIGGVSFIKGATFKDIDQFDLSLSNKNAGMMTTFVNGIRTMLVEAPQGYSNKKAEEIMDSYTETVNNDFMKPNVIVVMNESFSDLSVFCGIGDDEEYLHNLLHMDKNIQKGYVQVSVFGGNTANSEFEFLTGNSLYFLPGGYIPYMRTITGKTPSIVDDFKEQGYDTLAIHPYMPQCWRRNDVYPLLGFDKFISGKDFDPDHETTATKMRGSVDFGDLKYIRKYVSDEENYNMVLKQLKSKTTYDPMFIFNVTMQNHGPYTYKGKDFDEYLEDNGISLGDVKNRDEVMQYLTLIKESDRAFVNFLEELEKFDEPTVVVMFGDHLPGFGAVNNVISGKTPAEKQSKYTVPYYMWANYKIPTVNNEKPVSMAFLSNDLKKLINMPLTSWDMLREEVRESYPSLNAYGVFKADGEWVPKDDDTEKNMPDILRNYQIAQYGHLFKNINPNRRKKSNE